MNIHENVEKRAAHALSMLVHMFSFPLFKRDPLTYRSAERESGGWGIRYTRAKKWISRVYKPEITYTFELADNNVGVEYRVNWIPGKKRWKSTGEDESSLVNRFNEHTEMNQLLASVDMEKVELTKRGGDVTLTLIPIPGCFIWTMIPPIHYFVRLKPEEARTLTRAAGTIEQVVLQHGNAK